MGPDPSSSGEGRLRLDAQALGRVLAQLPATVWATDTELTVTYIDGQMLARLNISPDRIIGRRLQDLLLDGREDHPLIQGHLTALAGSENAVRIEWGGEVLSARIAPLRDAGGQIVGCTGVQQPIGWTPDLDGTLRESEIRLRRAIDANLAGIAFSNGDGQITDVNDAFLQMTGFTREDLVTEDLSWPSLTPVEEHHRQVAALDEVATTGRCAAFETRIIRRDGREIPVIVSGARLSARRREGVVFVLDISAYREAEARLKTELAAAVAILDAASLEDAGAAVLAIICDELGWSGAALWEESPLGVRSHIHRGLTTEAPSPAALVRRAFTSGRAEWDGDAGVLVVPALNNGKVEGALSVLGTAPDAPDAETIDLLERMASRLIRRNTP